MINRKELKEKLSKLDAFKEDLTKLVNSHSVDTLLGLNDFVIAKMMIKFIKAIAIAKDEREELKLKNDNIKKQNISASSKTRRQKDRIA